MRSFHGQRCLTRAIQIVPFRLRHLPRVLRIERTSFGSEAWPRKYFLELYCDCRAFFVVAKVGGRIAGFIFISKDGKHFNASADQCASSEKCRALMAKLAKTGDTDLIEFTSSKCGDNGDDDSDDKGTIKGNNGL